MEHKQQPQKKRFNEEEALDKAEKKLDEKMAKIMNKSFVSLFLNHKLIKDILHSRFVASANSKIQPSLKLIFTIVGRISLLSGIVGIFSFLVGLSGIGFMFTLGFGIGVRVLIYILLAAVFSLVSLFLGIGMLRHKKRVISLAILGFVVSVFSFVVSLIPVGLYSYSSYGSFGGSFFNLLVTFALLIIIIKNDAMFTY